MPVWNIEPFFLDYISMFNILLWNDFSLKSCKFSVENFKFSYTLHPGFPNVDILYNHNTVIKINIHAILLICRLYSDFTTFPTHVLCLIQDPV